MAALAMAACRPWHWLCANGPALALAACMPWLHALALAACPWGCLGLGSMPMWAALALVACLGLSNMQKTKTKEELFRVSKSFVLKNVQN
nr:hypothetical protein CFP56_45729 [Quercus suber]